MEYLSKHSCAKDTLVRYQLPNRSISSLPPVPFQIVNSGRRRPRHWEGERSRKAAAVGGSWQCLVLQLTEREAASLWGRVVSCREATHDR